MHGYIVSLLLAVLAFSPQARAGLSAAPTTSLNYSAGKTLKGITGNITTTTTTADQVVVTYTVSAGKTLYIKHFDFGAIDTILTATTDIFGTCSLESPAGTKLYTNRLQGTDVANIFPHFGESLPIAAGTVVRIVCTPASTTSFTFTGNILGDEL